MAMTAKRRRHGKSVAVDRLSDLPDEVLGHILSFLPTKKAVQTTVLSKRWTGLFLLATSLEFNDTMDGAVMNCMHHSEARYVNALITSALSLGADELDLTFKSQMDDMTLRNILSCSMLTVLRLNYSSDQAIPMIPTSVCLSSLVILKLEGIIFPDSDTMSKFFLGCSSLKDLTLSDCHCMNGEVYHISSSKLRNLAIEDWKKQRYKKTPTIVLDLPHMVYFQLCGATWKLYHFKNLNALFTAELYLSVPSVVRTEAKHLIRQLSSVKVLRLLGNSLKAIKRRELPTFVNLSRLEVGPGHKQYRGDWNVQLKWIGRSPALETLVFREGLEICYFELKALLKQRKRPFLKNPITIQVDGYRGSEKELELVKLLRKGNAFKVKQMIINNSQGIPL